MSELITQYDITYFNFDITYYIKEAVANKKR